MDGHPRACGVKAHVEHLKFDSCSCRRDETSASAPGVRFAVAAASIAAVSEKVCDAEESGETSVVVSHSC